MARRLILHPVLAALAPILFLYQHNIGHGAKPSAFLGWAAAFVAVALLAWWGFGRLTKEWSRSALLASFTTFALLTYGHFWMALSELHRRLTDAYLPSYSALVFVPWAALVAGGVWALLRMRKGVPELTTVAHGVLAVLVASSAIAVAAADALVEPELVRLGKTPMVDNVPPSKEDALPNVYYIVLDEYARQDVLLNEFGFDNSAFLHALGERGFDVATQSRSNYRHTFLSLPSTLNMAYLDPLAQRMPDGSTDQRPAYALIEESRVFDAFQGAGYELVTFSSGFEVTQENARSDHHVDCAPLTETDHIVLRTTLLAVLDQEAHHRSMHARITCILSTLQTVPVLSQERDAPLFTFAHIVSPHAPYVFDENGEYRGPAESRPDGDAAAYVAQMKHLNRRLIEVLDAILAAEEVPPVIIVGSDHGVRFLEPEGSAWDEERARNQFGTLNAVLLPGGEGLVRDDITNVNLFRVVLPHVLGIEMAELPDRTFATDHTRPYEWWDVTELTQPSLPVMRSAAAAD